MIEVEINSKMLKGICDAVSAITEKPAFVFQPVGLSVVSLDESKVMLGNLGLKKQVFDTYDVPDIQKVSFDPKELGKHLTNPAGTTMLSIQNVEYGDKENRLDLMIPSRYGFKTILIPILGEIEPSMVPKSMPYNSTCKIDLGALEAAARDADRVGSEFCRFSIGDENELVVNLKGDSSQVITVLEDSKSIIHKKFDPEAKFVLSKAYLSDAVRIGKNFTNIAKMSFGTEIMPILFDYQLNFEGTFKIYIAPVIVKEGE